MTRLVWYLAFVATVMVAHAAALIFRLCVRAAIEDPTGGDET